jgi:hypothetical protein
MNVHQAVGWQADWLNAWLAAVGVTRLLSNARLSWSDDAVPHAMFYCDHDDFEAALLDALPTLEQLEQLPIARRHPLAMLEFPRKVTRLELKDRAELARSQRDGSLESSVTDLVEVAAGECSHGPFDPPMQKGITGYERLLEMRRELPNDSTEMITATLSGKPVRVQKNGLGFDFRRFATGIQAKADVWVDPVIEFLCFYGLQLFPVRGSLTSKTTRQRRWVSASSDSNAFTWPVWEQPLDVWAIDALLDQVWPDCQADLRCTLGVHGMYGTLARVPKGQSDANRGYASERLW